MIKVIKNNYKPMQHKNITYRKVCSKCESVFVYDDNDVKEEDRGIYGPFKFVVCPCCNSEQGHYDGTYEIIKQDG